MNQNQKKINPLIGWLMLFFSSTCFSGFSLGLLFGKRGCGGGTMGAMVALLLQLLLLHNSIIWIISFTIASFVIGLLVVGPAEKFMFYKWGVRSRHTGEIVSSDFNETNIDEFHGQFLAAFPVWLIDSLIIPPELLLLIAFIIFRIFDAKKPWPIKQIEQIFKDTAFGIMIDDTAAAIPAAGIVLFLLLVV